MHNHNSHFEEQQNYRGARIDLYFLGSVDSASLLLRGSLPSLKDTYTNDCLLRPCYIPASLTRFHFPPTCRNPHDRLSGSRAMPQSVKPGQGIAETMPKLHLCATHLRSPATLILHFTLIQSFIFSQNACLLLYLLIAKLTMS